MRFIGSCDTNVLRQIQRQVPSNLDSRARAFTQGTKLSPPAKVDRISPTLTSDDSLAEVSSHSNLSQKMEAHMADTKDKHRSLEDRLAIVEDRIRRLESVRSGLHSEKTIFPPDAMCTSKQNVLRPVRTVETNGESHNSREPTEPPIAMELSTPILGLKVVKEPAVAASSDVRDISTDIHGIVKTDQPARRSKLASSVRQAQNDQQYHDEPHQPHPDTQKPSLELNDQTLNIESSKTEQSTLREFDLHRISEQGSRTMLKVQEQQMQLDGLLNQLRSLDEAISNIAEKLSSRNNANAIDHFTEVDTRLQSLAEQVVQLIGGEHARVTQTERKVADLTDSYSRVDQESKALREQLMRQQQHTSLQIEEIFDSIQRHKSIATTRHSSKDDLETVHQDINHLRNTCTDQAQSFQVERQLLLGELRRHQDLYRDMLCEYTLLLHDNFKAARQSDRRNSDSLSLDCCDKFNHSPLSLPMRGGRRAMTSGAMLLENLKLKEENSRLKSKQQASRTEGGLPLRGGRQDTFKLHAK
mmetsp:Transcript_3355/g.10995  ORF Transcript_3355/g.10995 Transcript_3355/m.10995 type:complete len:528 (+) Transcript_3355:371-1954(+)